jgi:hypothetical protein
MLAGFNNPDECAQRIDGVHDVMFSPPICPEAFSVRRGMLIMDFGHAAMRIANERRRMATGLPADEMPVSRV